MTKITAQYQIIYTKTSHLMYGRQTKIKSPYNAALVPIGYYCNLYSFIFLHCDLNFYILLIVIDCIFHVLGLIRKELTEFLVQGFVVILELERKHSSDFFYALCYFLWAMNDKLFSGNKPISTCFPWCWSNLQQFIWMFLISGLI